ncbi:unnamed protein product [Darwinula stevensoni]|uniref:PH domain-containing protein n=1 Tax=Darwinula stevensoni TaxID=69355 RepID=A0A7R9FRM0_9CRUS|nr:unnamed protein product [Darwinula stevensoni]CAG0901667.1 unnamed protein product [Darwinula stevensoni]
MEKRSGGSRWNRGTATPPGEAEIKGWLYKWANYIIGYQKRWFVLYNGLLSYYRTQAEMSHTCQGTMTMHGETIITEDSRNFVVSNGATQTWHLRASTEVDRQRWVKALELAKAKAIKMLELDMTTCEELIRKHGTSLQRALGELESLHAQAGTEGNDAMTVAAKVPSHLKTVSERAILFRITCNAMIKASSDYVDLATNQGRKWQRLLQHERDQRNQFEEMVMALAKQLSHKEESVKVHASSPFQAPPVTGVAKTNSSILTESKSDEGELVDAHVEGHEPKSTSLDFVVHECHKLSFTVDSLPATVSSSSIGMRH